MWESTISILPQRKVELSSYHWIISKKISRARTVRYQRQLTKRTFTKVLLVTFRPPQTREGHADNNGQRGLKITQLDLLLATPLPIGWMSCFSPFLLPGAKLGSISLDNLVNRKTNTSLLEERNPKWKHVTKIYGGYGQNANAQLWWITIQKINCGN